MNNPVSKLIKMYNFDPSVRYISKVRKGYLTNNVIIGNSQKKYFFKQYIDNEQRIRKTHKAKELFSSKGIPVIMPLKNIAEKTYFSLDDKCYALFPYVEGRQFRRLGMNRIALESTGKILAKIHLVTKSIVPQIDLPKRNKPWDKKDSLGRLTKMRDSILAKKEKTKIDKLALKLIKKKEEIIRGNKRKWNSFKLGKGHIIHGDFHEANIFFDDNSEVMNVFDWECVSIAPRTMEIARVLKLMCFNGRFTKNNYKKASIFLRAYDEIYPLKRMKLDEAIISEYVRQAHSLWVFDEYYLKGNKKISKFFDDKWRFLEYMSKNLEKHIKLIQF